MNIRKDGPTPNGGAYSIAYYLGDMLPPLNAISV